MPDLRPAVLLDVDGTLLDTNYLHVPAWWQAIEDTGHGPIAMSAIHRGDRHAQRRASYATW